MSSKEDLKIQADDITIVQGEKAKDYNVIVTSTDDAPLSGIPITIAFYNNDYTFEREATTNEYGVASVPIYLSGDAWFVDVHFKGNEQYKPQLVTKDVIIEKFERLDSYITSENLVINIDEPSMDGTYYTIYLKDSYDRPITDEPVSIKVEQTGVDDPVTYVDMVLKTDVIGRIVVPFLSYNENVKITSEYKGCTRFKPVINADIVAFEDVEPRNTIEFGLETIGGILAIEYKIGSGSWGELGKEDRVFLDAPIINKEDMDRYAYQGWFYFDSMNTGEYKITLCYGGQSGSSVGELSNTYPFCRTFTFENTTDTRKTIAEWVEYQGVSNIAHFTWTNEGIGNLVHLKAELEYELPFSQIGFTVKNKTYQSIPHYEFKDDGTRKTIVEYDVIGDENDGDDWSLRVYANDDFVLYGWRYYVHPTIPPTTKDNATLTQTGFGYNGQTYQNIDVTVSNDNASMHEKINEYYIMKLLNTDTLEEFYFYSYLIDNITPSHDEFELGIGNWRMEIVGKETENYKGAYYTTTASITDNTIIIPPQDHIITSAENYINLGTDTPTFVDDTITTATTDDDIHSIMALEFTNTNYYRLSFNAEIDGTDSTIIYGADPTLETKDGLFINNDSITLYNDDLEMDKLIFDTPIFNQANNNVLFQRYGNQFTIFVNDEQVYKTELLSWNTFGIWQDTTGSAITLSHFVLEPYITTEITPSVADYDGTVFGSNIRLEIKDNQLDLVDYGMLPSGAIGGGKIILNDIPLNNANNYAIQLEIKYNNSRFERLNNLTGEMQMRIYEDISTSDAVKDYAKVLCSPMPVPNSKTVFTRHSDEGTLYFVQNPYDATPTYLTNSYNLYKGGVEITTETGISLFNLDNAYSPVYVGNELVRAEFHRRSGFIRISRYDETSGDWATVNTLKLKNYPQLSLNEYNDDYAEIQFGQTVWKFYRGRPFIVVNHSKDDLRIMNLVDRVYCETVENQRGMGFIEEHDANCSTFNPQLSIQQFRQELHIGQNIKLDNFELYEDEYSLKEKSTIFEDACTSTSNKSSGYVQNTGSYSFDSNGLVIESKPTYMYFTDDGTSASHNDSWNVSNGTMTRMDSYTRLVESAQTLMCQMDSAYINPNSIVEFDFKAVDGVKNWGLVYIRNSNGGNSLADLSLNDVGGEIGEWIHLQIVFNDTDTITIYSSKLDNPITKTLSSTDTAYRLLIYGGGANTELHFKNVKVFRNYQANLRLDANNVYTVPFEVSFDLINDGNDFFRMYFSNTDFTGSAIASGTLWTSPSGQTTKVRFVVTEDGITRYINNTPTTLSLSTDVAEKVGVRFGYWQNTESSIKIKNYKVTQLEYINNIGEVATDSQMGITQIDNDNALVIVKEDDPLALNFPSYSSYVERVNDTFTLSIDYLDCPFENIKIKARGFDDKGAVPVKDGIQYGIWEQTVNVEVDTTATDSVKATFTNCPSEVKYIDFIIYFSGANSTDIILKDFMYYDGDAIINHDIDTSRVYAEQVEVQFADTYYANIYNDKSNCGLCIGRPYQEPFSLRSIYASSETVLIPYMKNCKEWDKPSQVFLEYLNANRQVIDIDWEN